MTHMNIATHPAARRSVVRVALWALGACSFLHVTSAHTCPRWGWRKGLCVWSLHVLPVSPRVGTLTKKHAVILVSILSPLALRGA